MRVVRRNGKQLFPEDVESFPVSELQPGLFCQVVHVTGGVWPVRVEEAVESRLRAVGGAQFELADVKELWLFY